ncbi:MAG: transglutaminase-like domain-containing protein [Crocinitomicaceae bacterium]|nr:transglutaminase-like domain-containing protein [Crocinitomicaceae bacterium]MDG1776127.1 transglutaminase-like domain-containing protein [Crocinitomicaceae bacterium]
MNTTKSIKALMRLCDDPDEDIYNHIKDELVSHGTAAIPFLEASWEEDDYDLLFQSRVEDLIHEIQYHAVKDDLTKWIDSPNKELIDGALLIARYQYPNFDEGKIRSEIKRIRDTIWLELSHRQTSFEKVRIFNKIFYGEEKFSGNSKDYNSPMNSYLNTVIETRKGNPLSLCILYSIIAQSLDMPIYGVNLPNHFILIHLDENKINPLIKSENKHGALFYINAFSKGGIFEELEIDEFLKGLNKPKSREYYEPCSNSLIIVRMLTNLITSFQQSGSAKRVKELVELRELFEVKF